MLAPHAVYEFEGGPFHGTTFAIGAKLPQSDDGTILRFENVKEGRRRIEYYRVNVCLGTLEHVVPDV